MEMLLNHLSPIELLPRQFGPPAIAGNGALLSTSLMFNFSLPEKYLIPKQLLIWTGILQCIPYPLILSSHCELRQVSRHGGDGHHGHCVLSGLFFSFFMI